MGVECCKNCKDRKVGCHSTCDIYKKACADWEKVKSAMRKDHTVDGYIRAQHFRAIDKLRKNRKNKRFDGF